MNKAGIVWILIAISYFIYSAVIAKHGFMFMNTIATIAMISVGVYLFIKK